MSEPLSIGSSQGPIAGGDVRGAIARAAQATGVDFDYLLAQAKIESSLDPSARARTSSAAGLYQFTQGTWLRTLERHGAEHGLGWTDGAIDGGRLRDPAMRAQVMALRNDPELSALMAGELANDNRAGLSAALGREPDAAELYLAHFLGLGGASRLLSADSGADAAALLPEAAAANRTIFYAPGGAPRTVGGVIELMRGKVAAAMEGGSSLPPGGGELAPDATLAWSALPHPNPSPQGEGAATARPSMADTLRSTFGLTGSDASAPAFVHAAYGRLRSLGL